MRCVLRQFLFSYRDLLLKQVPILRSSFYYEAEMLRALGCDEMHQKFSSVPANKSIALI